MRTCPECNNVVSETANFCDFCGLRLEPASIEAGPESAPQVSGGGRVHLAEEGTQPGTCSACGFVNLPGEMFCQNCGVQLSPIASTPPPPPTPLASPEEAIAADTSPIICPICGHNNLPGEAFCQNCGLQLPQRAFQEIEEKEKKEGEPLLLDLETSPMVSQREAEAKQVVSGVLIVKATKAEIALNQEKSEVTLGRADPVREIYPDIDLTSHGGDTAGVSRLHARLIAEGGQVFIEDLNSTNYTFLNRQKLQPGRRYLLEQGDEIRLGLFILEYRKE